MKMLLVFLVAFVAVTGQASPVGTSYATYLDNGWQSSRTLPNGVVTTYNFNAVGALTGMDNTLSSTGDITHIYGLTYDGVFNLKAVGFLLNPKVRVAGVR